MLAIEIDGDSHSCDKAKIYDSRRQIRLEKYGVKFLRFEDARLKGDINKVLEEIVGWIVAQGLHPPAPPSRGEESGGGVRK